MGRISTGVGLISGIDSSAIIDQLIALESRPKTILQTRISAANGQKKAYLDLLDRIKKIHDIGKSFERPTTFNAAIATSSNEDVLTATTSSTAAIGSYSFQVARLVTAQQTVSNSYADTETARVGAGSITVEMGGGEINRQTLLSELRGGDGVRRGQFRIFDRSGESAIIDVSTAVTLDDVVKKINSSLDISVKAKVDGDRLVLTDNTGSTANNFVIADVGDGHAAADLGIATITGGVASSAINGTEINYLGSNTLLSNLNDGLGVRRAPDGSSADVRITTADGGSFDVTLKNARNVSDVIKEIDSATGGKVKLSVDATGNGFTLTDTTAGAGAFGATAINDSKALNDLGLATAAAGNVISGSQVQSQINTVQLKRLNGGAGLTLGQMSITDRAGNIATIDLSAARSVQDVLDTITGTSTNGLKVEAVLKDSGNGIQIIDRSGGTGNLVIADVSANTATNLGLVGSFDTTKNAVGKNLQRQWVSESSVLADMNGGKGITLGQIRITNSTGATNDIDFTGGSYTSLGQVIKAINDKNAGVIASINANGDGIKIVDTAGGANKLKIEDLSGSTAKDLQIAKTATTTEIDGSYEKTIAVSAADTLATVKTQFILAGYGVSATTINDGTGHRLSLTAVNAGRHGRVSIDGGATSLQMRSLVDSQDAAVFIGGTGANEPLLVTGGSNQLTRVLPGVNIDLHSVSKDPVTLNVTRDVDKLVKDMQTFVDGFNEVVGKLDDLTKFDPETRARGPLLGDNAARQIQAELYVSINAVIRGAGSLRTIGDIGVKVSAGAKLEFDENQFRDAYAQDPEAVKTLFTQTVTTTDSNGTNSTTGTGLGAAINRSLNRLTDPVSGVIATTKTSIENKVLGFQDRMKSLDKLISAKRDRLLRQFSNMESVLAGLQSQQQSLGAFQSIPAASTAKK